MPGLVRYLVHNIYKKNTEPILDSGAKINSGAIVSVAARAVCLPTGKIHETQEGNPGAATLVTFSELQNGPRPIDVRLSIPMNKNIAAPCAMGC